MVPTPWHSRLRTAGIVLLLLCVLAGVLFSFLLPSTVRFSDEGEYLTLTRNLLHGPGYSMDGVHLTAMRPPGYSFFLAAIEALGGGMVAMRIVQYFLFAGTILLICRLFPANNRFVSVLVVTGVVMVYPVLFYTSSTLYPQTLAGFLFMLALTFLISAGRGFAPSLAAGLTFGVLILVVPTFLFTLIVVVATALMLKIVRWHNALLILVAASLLIGPWTARNAVQFHRFVPVASNSGANFLIGNCETTIPTGGSGNVDRTRYQREARTLGLDEFQEDNYYRQAAVTWIKGHPGQAVVLYFEKAANFFNVYNEFAPETQAEVSTWKQTVLGIGYGLLLALLAWRLVEMKRFPLTTQEKLFLIVYVLSAFTSAIFFTRIRLRLPYDYLIVAVVALHVGRRLGALFPSQREIK